jgi:citrate synthase
VAGTITNTEELKSLEQDLASRRSLPNVTWSLLREAAKYSTPVVDALRMAVGTLTMGRQETSEQEARTLVAAFPTIVGGYWRLRSGQEPLEPRETYRMPSIASIRSSVVTPVKLRPKACGASKPISTRCATTA